MTECPHCHREFGLSEWQVVNREIKRNKTPRINWSEYFGKSLSKKVAELKAKGFNKDMIYNKLVERCPPYSELRRKLLIGVCARVGEINSEMKEYTKVKWGKK